MKLFEIDIETSTVALNKPWIFLVPEFKALLDRDKGSAGDYRGDKKLKARKEFTYIYFLTDFASPITDYEDSEKEKEALYYANLEAKDIDDKVIAANKHYDSMQLKGAPALRSYRSLCMAREKMNLYFETLNMDARDKMGKLLNDPAAIIKGAKDMDAFYTAISNFRKRVDQELKDQSTGIRGTAQLGDTEEKTTSFSEADVIQGSEHAATGTTTGTGTFHNMGDIFAKLEKSIVVTEAEIGEPEEEDAEK